MEAIMLAAGIGSRLSPENRNYPPKCLLDFDGKSLLARHIEILRKMGTKKLTLITGYRADDIEAELFKVDGTKFAQTILNPNYQTGTIASLHCAKKIMQSGEDILVMDADVLCHPELIKRLTSSKNDFHILYDRNYEVGADPVLLCLKGREIIEFGKNVSITCDVIGEWPGFLKCSARIAEKVSKVIEHKIDAGLVNQPCEEAFREYMLSSKNETTYCDDITGIPWIEIDFPEDLERARDIILPAIKNYTR